MSEHKINVLERRVAALLDERDKLKDSYWEMRDALAETRSSVKFDLLTYEKKARAYGNIGPEGEAMHTMAEAEANRLHKLLDTIDALTNVGADKMGEVK